MEWNENKVYLLSIRGISRCHKKFFHYGFILENCQRDRCTPNGILKIGKYLQSQNGASMLVLNDTGNLEILCRRQKIWTTDTNDSFVNYLFFKNDGKIYLLGKDNSSRWYTKTSPTNLKSRMMLILNDGNVVVYDTCGNRQWQSPTGAPCTSTPGINFYLKV